MGTRLNNYNRIVKKRLIEWKNSFESANGVQLNHSAIAHIMQEEFGISTSPAKVGEMFKPDSEREIKLQELVALSQIFDIPLWNICEYPNASTSSIDWEDLVKRKKTGERQVVRPLSNPYYGGEYYCYYFKPQHYQDYLTPVEHMEIAEARLSIAIEDGRTLVTLTEMNSRTTFDGSHILPAFTLTGKLLHFENPEMAYSFIRDENGRRAMALMFSYLDLAADIRYYMTVAMLTFSWDKVHKPLFQKMAVFKERQDCTNPETEEIVRGILALNTCPIAIEEETMKKLAEEDPDIRKLLEENRALKTCYVYSEAALNDSFFFLDNEEKTRKLLKLKKNSLYPAHEVVAEEDSFSHFIKDYQIQQREEKGI